MAFVYGPVNDPKTKQYYSRHIKLENGNESYVVSIKFPETQYFYSGGIAINHNNPSEIILSKEVNGVFELRKYITFNNGGAWSKQNITNNSKTNNVRPYIVNSNDACLFNLSG